MTPEESERSERIADEAVSTWQAIDAALSPILGARGVAALYRRSLALTAADHPWLRAVSPEDSPERGDFTALRTVLSRQPSESGAAVRSALLHTFRELLTKLIGESLTRLLLSTVRDFSEYGPAVQDTSI